MSTRIHHILFKPKKYQTITAVNGGVFLVSQTGLRLISQNNEKILKNG